MNKLFLILFFSFAFVSAQDGNLTVAEGNLNKNSAGVAIVRPDQVTTEEDLQTYSRNIPLMNEKIGDIFATTNSDGSVVITVDYIHPGRFLGLFSANFKIINKINSSTAGVPSVTSRPSFWSGLVSGNNTDIDYTNIESRLMNNEIILNETKPNATPLAKARVIEAVVNELNKLQL